MHIVAALGMLSTIATGLAIDAYGPISDNAGGIAEKAGMSHRICERIDALDAAGITTASIGKDSKGVDDFGDVIREDGVAFAKGLFRGVTGILTKPLEGAKSSGVEGFVQRVGKGIIGAAAQPVRWGPRSSFKNYRRYKCC